MNGYQVLRNATIIGESPNLGDTEQVVRVKEGGRFVHKKLGRSYPFPKHMDRYMKGVLVDSEGPLHLHDVDFKGFQNNDYRPACAIQFKDNMRHGMGASSSVKGPKKLLVASEFKMDIFCLQV